MNFASRTVAHLSFVFITFLLSSSIANSQTDNKEINDILVRLRKEQQQAEWSYEKLMKNADTVVIATFDSQRKIDMKLKDETGFADSDSTEVFESTLNVLTPIKGKIGEKQIKIRHLKWDGNTVVLVNYSFFDFKKRMARDLVVIDDKGISYIEGKDDQAKEIDGVKIVRPEYLLFLRKQKDGTYVSASNQRFAGKSARIINR